MKRFYISFLLLTLFIIGGNKVFAQVTINNITYSHSPSPYTVSASGVVPPCGASTGTLSLCLVTNSLPAGTNFTISGSNSLGNTYLVNKTTTTPSELFCQGFSGLAGSPSGVFYTFTIKTPKVPPSFNDSTYLAVINFQVFSTKDFSAALNITQPRCPSPPNTGSASVGILSGTSPYNYTWSVSPNPGNSATANNLLAQHFSVYVKDASGCDTTMQGDIVVQQPTVTLVASPNPVCNPTSFPVAITYTATPGSGWVPGKYYWDGSSTGIDNGASSSTKITSAPTYGNYSHSVIFADVNGCLSAPVSVTVPVDIKPTLTATANPPSVCPGLTSMVTANLIACSMNGGTCQYSFGGAYASTNTYTTFPINKDTSVIVTVKNSSGCISDPAIVNIDTSGKPRVIPVVTPSPICPNAAYSITANCATNCTSIQMNFNGNGFIAGSPQTFNQATTPAAPLVGATTSYTLQAKGVNGCVFDTTVTVVVFTNTLVITPTGPTTVCANNAGSTISLTASGFKPATPITWSTNPTGLPGDGSNSTTVLASSPVAGPFSYTVTGTDVNNCPRTTTDNFTANPQPTITATSPVDYCEGTTTTLSASGTPAPVTFLWYNSGYTSTVSPTISGLTANATFHAEGTDANGCKDTADVNVLFHAKPVISSSTASPTTICAGNNVTITINPVNPFTQAAAGGYIYNVTTTSTNSLSVGPFASNDTVVTQLKNNFGCLSDVVKVPITVTPFTVSASKIDVSCYGSTDGSAVITVTGGTSTFSLSVNSGAYTPGLTSPYNGLTNLAGDTSKPASPQGKLYTIDVRDNSLPQPCSASTTFFILQPLPLKIVENIAAHQDLTCFNQTPPNGSFAVTSSGGTIPYSYTLNGAAQGGNSTYTNLAGGLAPAGLDYNVIITDSRNCTNNVHVKIYEPTQLAMPSLTTTKNKCFGDTSGTISVAQASGGTGPNYSYSINSTPTQSVSPTAVAPPIPTFKSLPAGTNIYTVTITDSKGCSISKDTTLSSNPPVSFGPSATVNDTCGSGQGSLAFTTSASGGTAPYTYIFNGTAQTLPYTITSVVSGVSQTVHVIDALSCTFDASYAVTNALRAVPYISITKNLCFGDDVGIISIDSLQSNVPGYSFSPPYSYGISIDATPLPVSLPWPNTVAGGSAPLFSAAFNNLKTNNYVIEIKDVYHGQPCYYPMDRYFLKNTTASGYAFYDSLSSTNGAYAKVKVLGPADITASVFSHESDLNVSNGTVWVYNISGGTPAISNGKPVYQLAVDNPSSYQSYVPRDTTFPQSGGTVDLYSVLGGYAPGAHTLYIKDANNCEKVINIDVPGNFFIPNLVIPGSTKEKNRTFYITSLPDNSQLRVYNRWGDRVYYNKDYDNTFDAAGLGDGVYYYDLELTTGTRYKGWVQVTSASGN